jgi:hypothetical protein
LHSKISDAVTGVAIVGRNSGVFTTNFDPGAALHVDRNAIVQGDGLVDRQQLVEAVRPEPTNAQTEIDLGEGMDGDCHEGKILNGKFRFSIADLRPNEQTTKDTKAHEGRLKVNSLY